MVEVSGNPGELPDEAASDSNDGLGGTFTWKGKTREECTLEELNEIIDWLLDLRNSTLDSAVIFLRNEVSKLQNENEKLWKCLGHRDA